MGCTVSLDVKKPHIASPHKSHGDSHKGHSSKHGKYTDMPLPQGSVKVGAHAHAFPGPSVRTTGWACDSKKVLVGKCKGDYNNFYLTDGVTGYNCPTCEWDFCGKCM